MHQTRSLPYIFPYILPKGLATWPFLETTKLSY